MATTMITEISAAHADGKWFTDVVEPSFKSFWNWTNGLKYDDGSFYKGHLDRFGKRIGSGTLRTPIYIYGVVTPSCPTSILNWMEYKGEWQNDKPAGFGTARRYRGDGTSTILYKGVWANGDPVNDP